MNKERRKRIDEVREQLETLQQEIENRANTEVLYFRTKHYHTFGIPLFKEDDHYFSK